MTQWTKGVWLVSLGTNINRLRMKCGMSQDALPEKLAGSGWATYGGIYTTISFVMGRIEDVMNMQRLRVIGTDSSDSPQPFIVCARRRRFQVFLSQVLVGTGIQAYLSLGFARPNPY